MTSLPEQFGAIDIYLFDQLLRGRIARTDRILDAGCGHGRNLHYLLREGYDVQAVDMNPRSIAHVERLFAQLAPQLPGTRVRQAGLEELPYEAGSFDFVFSNAVLHFARDDAHFEAMVQELFRVLAPGGTFFARLASDIGIETRVRPLGDGRYDLPDDSERYLVNEARLLALTEEMGGTLLDPLKTTNVQGLRCMTTWVVRGP
jgi:tellurite methyltransferase